MTYQDFEAGQAAFQDDMVAKYDRAFRQYSNQELVRVFNQMITLENVSCILELGAHRAPTSKRFMRAQPGRKAVDGSVELGLKRFRP